VKSKALSSPLEQAFLQSRLVPFVPAQPLSDGYHQFLSLAAHLQKLMPNRNILLPVERVGEMLRYNRHTISHYLHLAKLSGHLREVSPSLYAKHQATEYRFSVENWDFATGRERQPTPDSPTTVPQAGGTAPTDLPPSVITVHCCHWCHLVAGLLMAGLRLLMVMLLLLMLSPAAIPPIAKARTWKRAACPTREECPAPSPQRPVGASPDAPSGETMPDRRRGPEDVTGRAAQTTTEPQPRKE
jgi:hypothetical protein